MTEPAEHADRALLVVLVTLSEPVAARFARLLAEQLSSDVRFEVIGTARRKGWRGGGADILVRMMADDPEGLEALGAALDRAVDHARPRSSLTRDAVVLIEVVPAAQFEVALSRAHVTVRESLRGMGLY